ncbi:MAG: hypothetical protein ACKO4U_11160 [Caldilinea sp.]
MSPLQLRWLLPLTLALSLAGYFGPWLDHKVAGLVITGLDLGEYVKFLPAARSMALWREGFYLPLIASSLAASLFAFRADLRCRWPLQGLLLGLATASALNLLPPAWTPQRMLTDEFRQQAVALALCLAAMAFSPLLALLPRQAVAGLIAAASLAAAVVPACQFLALLPAINDLYHQPQLPGWGLFLGTAGLLTLASSMFFWIRFSKETQ